MEEAINSSIISPACHDAVSSEFIYTFLSSYSCIYEINEQLHTGLMAAQTSAFCERALISYYCNYVYPGCNPNNTQQPIGICKDSCSDYLFGTCASQFVFTESLGMTSDRFSFPVQCDNTLRFLLDSGLNVTGNEENCNDISGTLLSLLLTGTNFSKFKVQTEIQPRLC